MPSFKLKTINTRSAVPFNPFPFKHVYFSKTFLPFTTSLYNKLPYCTRNERDILEYNLGSKYTTNTERHFNRGISKYVNSLHTQLRLSRSLLAAHGFAIGLNDTNLCICSRPETTKHFFTCLTDPV